MRRRYTGVKDINGRKIYTGDTVKMHYFTECFHPSTLGAYEGEAEVVGRVGHCWGKFYTEQEERHYYSGKLVTEKVRYYWKTYLQEPHEELEVIVEARKMTKQELAHIAKVMHDLQRYCVWQVYNEHPNYCGYCPLWSYKDNECSLFMLYNGEYQKNCTGEYPCKWHITEADIERLERETNDD